MPRVVESHGRGRDNSVARSKRGELLFLALQLVLKLRDAGVAGGVMSASSASFVGVLFFGMMYGLRAVVVRT